MTGRFITRDTVTGSIRSPQTMNRYVYCLNNPHKYTDADGKCAEFIIAGTFIGAV
ncbi:hypothetical protein HN682_00905 [Candidatus Peregrinibacteria bacterium]|nr:hypothetical protein [Candidatus Peregrinibacteria bacterium]